MDLSNTNEISKLLNRYKNVIFLASVVGDPITKKYPYISKKINEEFTIRFIDSCIINKVEKFIFISTCSNYGIIPDTITADENYKLDPISLYAKSKVKIEKYLLATRKNNFFNPTILRFATAFGLSKRMRFDLTINEFTKTLYDKKKLIIYDENTWRPYCHLLDFSNLIFIVLQKSKEIVGHQVFNAGSDDNNYTKKMIVDKILEFLPKGQVEYSSNGSDPRNYKVNFNKVKNILNFEPKYDLNFGIRELISYLDANNATINNDDFSRYGNFNIQLNYD